MKKFTALANMMTPVVLPYGTSVSFHAVYDANNDEHRKWAEATPSMSINMNVKPDVAEQMEPGQYIVTFEKVEN